MTCIVGLEHDGTLTIGMPATDKPEADKQPKPDVEDAAQNPQMEAMMKQMGAEQSVLIAQQMRLDDRRRQKRRRLMDRYFVEGMAAAATIVLLGWFIAVMFWIVQDRIEKYPHLGNGWIPKSEQQQRKEAQPKVYIGR